MTKRQREKYQFNLNLTKMSKKEHEEEIAEKRLCAHFGCPVELSITEQLYNDRCHEHQKEQSKQFSNGKL